jgi:DNA-directed RNA polymerase sigma subunit (sigma70/sigma32)
MKRDDLDILENILHRVENLEREDISDRLANIEKQFKFFTFACTEMKALFNEGVKIYIDENAMNHLHSMNKSINDFTSSMQKEMLSIRKMREEIRLEHLKDNTAGALEFVGRKSHEIEAKLDLMMKSGISKNIRLDFTCEGYEMVKKKVKLDTIDLPEMKEIEPDTHLNALLNTLLKREKEVLEYRYGLNQKPKLTLDGTAKKFNLTSRETVRRIHAKAIGKCRHPSRLILVHNLSNCELKKDILGV